MKVLSHESTTQLPPVFAKPDYLKELTAQCSLMLAFKVFDIVSKNADSGESANNLK